MKNLDRFSRIFVIAGLLMMVVGAVDPLEGSLLILPGSALAALGGRFGHSPYSKLLLWSFVLVSFGVAILFGLSALGGLGGDGGRSMWWVLVLLPYPAGWVMGLVGAVRTLRIPPSTPIKAGK